jgi:signal transduction histidine kinase
MPLTELKDTANYILKSQLNIFRQYDVLKKLKEHEVRRRLLKSREILDDETLLSILNQPEIKIPEIISKVFKDNKIRELANDKKLLYANLQTQKIQRQNEIYNYSFLAVIFLLGFASFYLYNSNKKKKKIELLVKKTQAQKNELEEQYQELKASEEELKQNLEALAEAHQSLNETQQAKEDFTGMVVHDLRNPLNPILSLSNAEFRQFPAEDLQKNLFVIQESGKRISKLIDNILDIQQYENSEIPLHLNTHSLYQTAEEAIGQVKFFAQQKGLQMQNEISPDLLAEYDEVLIERVFENFLTNAIKYTPNGGKISFRSEVMDTQIKISICDTGEGIPADKIDKIFDRFTQIEARKFGNTRSTGIGLTFCKMALLAHQSEIEVRSEAGKGAEFSFYLPWVTIGGSSSKNTQVADNQPIAEINLSEADKIALADFIQTIRQYDLNGVDNYKNELLQTLPAEPSETLQTWLKALWEAVDNLDRHTYEKLLSL